MQLSRLGDTADLLRLSVGIGVCDIVLDRSRKQKTILLNNSYGFAYRRKCRVTNVLSVDSDRPNQRIVKTREQVHQSRFSRARRADNADGLTLMCLKTDA